MRTWILSFPRSTQLVAVIIFVAVNVPQVVVTVAVNCCEPPAGTVAVVGLTATLRIWSVTVTVAVALFVVSAWLVATT